MRRQYERLRPGEQTGADWTKPTSVYVIASEGRSKVGIATDPAVRMGYLQLACPYQLKLIDQHQFDTRRIARDVEKAIHEQFAPARLWGEWFDAEAAVVVAALRECVRVRLFN